MSTKKTANESAVLDWRTTTVKTAADIYRKAGEQAGSAFLALFSVLLPVLKKAKNAGSDSRKLSAMARYALTDGGSKDLLSGDGPKATWIGHYVDSGSRKSIKTTKDLQEVYLSRKDAGNGGGRGQRSARPGDKEAKQTGDRTGNRPESWHDQARNVMAVLIGAEMDNAHKQGVPRETILAFCDHGRKSGELARTIKTAFAALVATEMEKSK